jgi:hypothetical protein
MFDHLAALNGFENVLVFPSGVPLPVVRVGLMRGSGNKRLCNQ